MVQLGSGRAAGLVVLLIAVGVLIGLVLGAEWAAVWVCAVVGVHFFPLARVLPGLALTVLGAGGHVSGRCGLLVGAATDVPPTAVTGPGTGLLLLVAAVGALNGLLRARRGAVRE